MLLQVRLLQFRPMPVSLVLIKMLHLLPSSTSKIMLEDFLHMARYPSLCCFTVPPIYMQFKIMLDVLEDFLHMAGYPCERIDGSTSSRDRQAAIDRYSKGESIIFKVGPRWLWLFNCTSSRDRQAAIDRYSKGGFRVPQCGQQQLACCWLF